MSTLNAKELVQLAQWMQTAEGHGFQLTQEQRELIQETVQIIERAEYKKHLIIHLVASPFVNKLGVWRVIIKGATIIDSLCGLFCHTEFMMKRAISSAWEHYSRKVVRHIPKGSMEYKDQILDYCLTHTPIFYRYRQYCGHQLSDDTNIGCS